MSNKPYDFIAVGLGPFNLGLACLSEPIDNLNGLFLDKKSEFDWHPGMMLESATLQTPFLADLVTLADPTHPLSFLNYIKKQGRIYSFYIRESFFLMRKEYNQYCQWACQQLTNIRFNSQVKHINFNESTALYEVEFVDITNGDSITYEAKKIVLGSGPSPYIPQRCESVKQQSFHSSQYLEKKATLLEQKSITVVGSGQSAAEIFYDLLQEIDVHGYQLNWLTRSPRFFPLEYSKLTLEMTSPEYVDYFYNLPEKKRHDLISQQKHLYKGINSSLINDIYDLLYTKRLYGEVNVGLHTNTELTQASLNHENDSIELQLYQNETEKKFNLQTSRLVLATGFQYQLPDYLSGIVGRIKWDKQGRFDVNRNYSIDTQASEIFVQNVELHTHGFVTPDLGMACYRNAWLIKELTGIEHYPIENKIAFQQFSAPTIAQQEYAKV